MKKLVVCLALISNLAWADGYRHHHGGGNWIAPFVLGGIVGYGMSRPYVMPPPVIPPPPPVIYNMPPTPYGYRYETIFDAYCNCYRTVLIPY
jgi:hypothetical protein